MLAHRSLKNSFSWRNLLVQMSSKQALDMAGLRRLRLRCFLSELLELTGEGVKEAFLRDFHQKLSGRCENEAFVRDFPQKFNVDYVKIKISCEGVLAVVATVVGDSGCWQ